MRVAVTGATGFIGRELCAALLRDGHTVVALTRDPRRAQAALPGALVANWGDPAAALPPVDGVVNLAGESVAGRWSEEKKRRLRESRIAGTRRLVETIARAPERPTVLVSASAVGYYGDRGEETLTEASGPGRDFLAQLCQEWEASYSFQWRGRSPPVRWLASITADLRLWLCVRLVALRVGLFEPF